MNEIPQEHQLERKGVSTECTKQVRVEKSALPSLGAPVTHLLRISSATPAGDGGVAVVGGGGVGHSQQRSSSSICKEE